MAKRIEPGELVIGTKARGRYGTRQITGRLHQRPSSPFEPYLVDDGTGYLHPCYKVRRLKK